jgi:CHAT domain-containing protein
MRMFARDPGELTEYRSLLALRARLARGTPISPGDPASSDQRMSEVDFQIQSLEYEARSRAQGRAQLTMSLSMFGSFGSPEEAEWEKYNIELRDERERLSQQYIKHPPKNDTRSGEELLKEVERAAKAKVDPKYRKMFARMEAVPRGVREELLGRIQTRLPADAVLLEMLRFRPLNVAAASEADRWQPARYGAYVIKRGGAPTFIDFGESTSIDDLIAEFRRTLAQPRGTLAHDLGRRLDAILMQPVRAALGTATTIHLAPDGALNLVPFAALVDEDDRYLIERFTFDYLSSGRDLMRPVSAAPAATTTVVIGDPAFDGDVVQASTQEDATLTRGLAGHRFDRLPGTAAEAQAIAGLLKASTVLTGAAATETAIKSVEAPRVLHIATHGFFLADQDLSAAADGRVAGLEDPMLRSGLVFAGANIGRSGTDDGVLTALEAAGLNLSGTQLVVLSACETAVGEVRNGEGVFGLRRAFMVAGTETLVMSLWQVEDTATQQLMTEFYRRLSNGQGRAEALRQASLTLMRDPSRRHPFFWGSFIASGEAGPLHR